MEILKGLVRYSILKEFLKKMHNELAGLSDTTTNSQVVTLVLPSSPSPFLQFLPWPLGPRSGGDGRRGVVAAGAGFLLTFSFPLAMMVERKENINGY